MRLGNSFGAALTAPEPVGASNRSRSSTAQSGCWRKTGAKAAVNRTRSPRRKRIAGRQRLQVVVVVVEAGVSVPPAREIS
jgi:hypothetical protein